MCDRPIRNGLLDNQRTTAYSTWKVMGIDTHTGTCLSRFMAGLKVMVWPTLTAAASRAGCPLD